jgi:hypothetical protein
MPSKERYWKAKELDVLFKDAPPEYKAHADKVNSDLSELARQIEADEGKRLAAQYGSEANAARSAASKIELAKFAAKYAALLAKNQSARWVATRIKESGSDTRSIEAIAINVRAARRISRASRVKDHPAE